MSVPVDKGCHPPYPDGMFSRMERDEIALRFACAFMGVPGTAQENDPGRIGRAYAAADAFLAERARQGKK